MAGHDSQRMIALVEQIKTAFEAVEYPGDDQLFDPRPDDWWITEEQEYGCFRDEHRDELSIEFMRINVDGLRALRPAAFLYFLPTYLICCLREYEQADALVYTVQDLLVPRHLVPGGALVGEAEAWHATLTPDQRGAIRAFLEFMRDEHPLEEDHAFASLNRLERAKRKEARVIEYWA